MMMLTRSLFLSIKSAPFSLFFQFSLIFNVFNFHFNLSSCIIIWWCILNLFCMVFFETVQFRVLLFKKIGDILRYYFFKQYFPPICILFLYSWSLRCDSRKFLGPNSIIMKQYFFNLQSVKGYQIITALSLCKKHTCKYLYAVPQRGTLGFSKWFLIQLKIKNSYFSVFELHCITIQEINGGHNLEIKRGRTFDPNEEPNSL